MQAISYLSAESYSSKWNDEQWNIEHRTLVTKTDLRQALLPSINIQTVVITAWYYIGVSSTLPTSMMEPFLKNSSQLKAVKYFCKSASS